MDWRRIALTGFAVAALVGLPAIAQAPTRFDSPGDAQAALETARQQQRNARARSEKLEQQASRAQVASQRATTEVAALAARVQQAEADIAAAEARLALVNRERRALDRQLAARRAPLARLTGALQSMSQRPLSLSALQPGSLRDLVYTRAVLDSTIPVVRQRTAGLRRELDRANSLQAEARQAVADRRDSEALLQQRRNQLVSLAERERLRSRQAAGGADREAQRALVLAEQAIDLDQLVGRLEAAGTLRERLAALPGPIPRPADPALARAPATATPSPGATAPPSQYQLPVGGEITAGFGEAGISGQRQAGIALATRPGAQIVAPAAGRVAYAGPYKGYRRIAIIEHPNGWTSLVTGIDTLDVVVGQSLEAGSPLGLAPRQAGEVTLELRRNGEPVNPLDHLR